MHKREKLVKFETTKKWHTCKKKTNKEIQVFKYAWCRKNTILYSMLSLRITMLPSCVSCHGLQSYNPVYSQWTWRVHAVCRCHGYLLFLLATLRSFGSRLVSRTLWRFQWFVIFLAFHSCLGSWHHTQFTWLNKTTDKFK